MTVLLHPYKLNELCEQITDGKHGDCQNQSGSGFFFLSAKDVVDGNLVYETARQITEADFHDTHKRTRLEPFDVLITNSGTIGRMAIAKDNERTSRTTFQKSVAILKPNRTRVDPRFLYYLLQSEIQALGDLASGTAQKNLLLGSMREYKVAIPERSTQRKIASILSAYDDLIENNTRRIQILEEMARNLYREWFVHFRFPGHENTRMVETAMGLIPKGWEYKQLGQLASEVRRSVEPAQVDADTPYVGLEHLPRRSITLGEWGCASEVQSTKLRFCKGEILFGKIRPYFHKVGVAAVDGVCSSDTIVIVPREATCFGLVLSCVSSDEFVNYATQTSQGTKMPRANWQVLVKYPIAMPPLSLLLMFNTFINDIVTQTQKLAIKNLNLRKTRDLLLPRLISGELDVSALEVV